MVAYKGVIKAFNQKIKNKYPAIQIVSNDIDDGITRPSFMTSLQGITESNFMNNYRDSNFNVKIRYFASKAQKNLVENLGVIDDLKEIFINDPIIIADDFSIEIYDEIEIDIIDSVVHFTIPVFISDEIIRNDDTPQLEELEFNEKGMIE